MGYATYINGELTIEPHIPDLPNTDPDLDPEFIAEEDGSGDTVGMVNGEITVIPGKSQTTVTWAGEESRNNYDFEEHLAELVAYAVDHGATKFDGAFVMYGEEEGDISRFRVDNNKVIHEVPQLLWPNGDIEDL